MSIILDALKRGRLRPAPRQNPDTAQTDAVLQTLGYKRFSPTTPLNRLKRVVAYLVVAGVCALVLWGAIVWTTQTDSAMPPGEPGPVSPPKRAAPPPSRPALAQLPAPSTTVQETPEPAAVAPPIPVRSPLRPGPPTTAAGSPWRGSSSPPAEPATATISTRDDQFGRALMYQRLGDFENALVSYRQVLQRDDLNVEAHNNLGVLYRDKGLFDDAITHFQRAIAINPRYARARNNLGVVFLNQRKLDAAATQFHAALAIDPNNVESLVNLSTVDRDSKYRDEARVWLVRALAIDPHNAEAHYNLGLIEDEAGNTPNALAHYREFLQYGAAAHPILVGEVRKRIDALGAK